MSQINSKCRKHAYEITYLKEIKIKRKYKVTHNNLTIKEKWKTWVTG